ncbi:hypothetical protein [Iodobacter fluviatilis]|uniref:Uncharacterized protein n=1 Tax=Iodobacter fluviatilis TaxID=537 RepID=A0A377SW20_9NEIS|nr:hypothetical protein [Iodobacter fluviatilis]TCU86268.1 hypothetical protein EV682_106153 [Iodobacter fluviatilis]STR44679.1 Uncharacterised protein [Iodobacter fluviatilis]
MSGYRDLFGAPAAPMRDLFGEPKAPQTAPASENLADLFAGQTPPAKPDEIKADKALSTAPKTIASTEGVNLRYAELIKASEQLMHRVIDLTQSVKSRENLLNTLFTEAKRQADDLQAAISPKRSLLFGKKAPDKAHAHALIDQLQLFMRQELKPDLFLQNDIDELLRQTDYLDRLADVLKKDALLVLAAEDQLLSRILTQAHILSLQAASTRQLTAQLDEQLLDIENWRGHFLSLLVVDIQQKL